MPASSAPTDAVVEPRGRVAPGTHPQELRRLALEESLTARLDPLTSQAFIWLHRAYNAAAARNVESLRDTGLSPSAFNVLMALHNTPGRTLEPCALAERLLITRPSVTGLLDTLQARGLIRRAPHAADRRRVLVALTDAGEALLERQVAAHFTDIAGLFAGLDADELEQLVVLLRRVDGAVPPSLRG